VATAKSHILILGGYGRAGLEIARLLLNHTTARVTLGGHTLEKAQNAANSLNENHPGERVLAKDVDATQRESLQKAFAECDIVIVCVPYKSDSAEKVITAALEAGIDYIDINNDPGKHDVFAQMQDRIRQGDSIFMTEAGIIPGCPAVMLRYIAAIQDDLRNVAVSVVMLDDHMPRGSAHDMIDHAGQTAKIYRAGRWQAASPFHATRIDFGSPFGKRLCVPIDLAEMHAPAKQLSIDSLIVYQSGFNPAVNSVFALWKLLGLSRFEAGLRLGVDLFMWANRNFTPPPHGIQLILEADQQRLSLYHDDVYVGTAVPVVAAVMQLLDCNLYRPQQGYMGHIIEPTRFMNDLKQLGIKIEHN
jgi:saccharopine dehydrogenase-like NADP-dependent oxidoreductase